MEIEQAQAYCQTKAAADGTDFYYATLYLPSIIKTRLLALQALYIEVSDVIRECSDPGIARIKLAWWHEEIERLSRQSARHPVTQALTDFNNDTDSTSLLPKLIDGIEQRLSLLEYEDKTAIEQNLMQTSAILWTLFANTLDCHQGEILSSLIKTGNSLEYLQQLRQSILLPEIRPFAIDDLRLKENDLSSDHLFEQDTQLKLHELMMSLIKEELSELKIQYQILAKENNRSLLFALTLNRIHQQHCKRQLGSNSNTELINAFTSPVQKLWISWREKNRFLFSNSG